MSKTKNKKIKKEEIASQRREQILKSAVKVFSKCGFAEADVEEIARLANLGKGTVYRYFETKENLFFATVQWTMEKVKNETSQAMIRIDDPFQQLKDSLQAYLCFFEKHREFYRVLFEERKTLLGKVKRRMIDKYFSFSRIFEKPITEGIKTGIFVKVKPQETAFALLGLTDALVHKWLVSEKKYSLKGQLPLIITTFFNGLLKKK
ncbi:MAG: TetR/AcrR family transcriptional regulator [Candidatus Edwardsbacteria bacterium]